MGHGRSHGSVASWQANAAQQLDARRSELGAPSRLVAPSRSSQPYALYTRCSYRAPHSSSTSVSIDAICLVHLLLGATMPRLVVQRGASAADRSYSVYWSLPLTARRGAANSSRSRASASRFSFVASRTFVRFLRSVTVERTRGVAKIRITVIASAFCIFARPIDLRVCERA